MRTAYGKKSTASKEKPPGAGSIPRKTLERLRVWAAVRQKANVIGEKSNKSRRSRREEGGSLDARLFPGASGFSKRKKGGRQGAMAEGKKDRATVSSRGKSRTTGTSARGGGIVFVHTHCQHLEHWPRKKGSRCRKSAAGGGQAASRVPRYHVLIAEGEKKNFLTGEGGKDRWVSPAGASKILANHKKGAIAHKGSPGENASEARQDTILDEEKKEAVQEGSR